MPDSAYNGVITIEVDATRPQLAAAARVLAETGGVVLLHGAMALRSRPGLLACEVIDPSPGAHRCAEEFKVLIENARRMLAASRLSPLLPSQPRRWAVVEDRGTEVFELWTDACERLVRA